MCMGEGCPTVLLDARAGGWSAKWEPVQPHLAHTTRVCSWDRAGSGWSDLGTHGHTAQAYGAALQRRRQIWLCGRRSGAPKHPWSRDLNPRPWCGTAAIPLGARLVEETLSAPFLNG